MFLITTEKLKHFLPLLSGPGTAEKMGRGHQCSRAAHHSGAAIVPTLFSLWRTQWAGCLVMPWPGSSWEGPWAPALLQNNACGQHWHLPVALATSVRMIRMARGCPPKASTCSHKPYFSPCLQEAALIHSFSSY